MYVIDKRERVCIIVEALVESAKKPVRPIGMKRDRSPGLDDFPVIAVRNNTNRNARPNRVPSWDSIPEYTSDKAA
jgi:hypothetical protein